MSKPDYMPETISVNDALDAGYIGDDCYVTYQVTRGGKATATIAFHYDTRDNGWFMDQFFRDENGRIRTRMVCRGFVATLIPAEKPMCLAEDLDEEQQYHMGVA